MSVVIANTAAKVDKQQTKSTMQDKIVAIAVFGVVAAAIITSVKLVGRIL